MSKLLLAIGIALSTLCGTAHADDHFYSPIRECQLPDGDPQGYPCVHTAPNGKAYIDWSDAHHPDSALPPVGGEYFDACTRMGDCP